MLPDFNADAPADRDARDPRDGGLRPAAPAYRPSRARVALRILLSSYFTNGLAVAFGYLLISGGLHAWLGQAAGAAAGVGVIIASVSDQPWPRRGKLRQMLIGPVLALPLFLGVQYLQGRPWALGLLLVPATFVAFTAMAWGKRGIPIAIAAMLAMIFAMAAPGSVDWPVAAEHGGWFALGAALYVIYSVLANLALNARYRSLSMVDLLLSLGTLMRTQAHQFDTRDPLGDVREVPVSMQGRLLAAQAALADQLQSTRDLVLESPRTARRQRLAGMLLAILEIRDHLVASELDLDALRALPGQASALTTLHALFEDLARETEAIADAMLLGRRPAEPADHRAALEAIGLDAARPVLLRGLANRLTHLNHELIALNRLARGEVAPNLAAVRASWQLFVSPTSWSLAPFLALWRWDAPPLRHALRASMAVATGYAIAVLMPWGSHEYWILLTIVVVLRGSLAQTLERRNSRVAGTLVGCVVALGVLAAAQEPFELLIAITAAQAIAHGFAIRRYLVASIGATVLGLIQAHLLSTGLAPGIALVERIADTLIGAGVAWAFCYVLPSWERHQLGALLRRVLAAQARHAKLALGLAQWRDIGSNDELAWRLARREAFDSLSALVQATQRSLVEPRAVRPPLAELETLQMHCYQFLAQMSAIKSLLLLRRDWLTPTEFEQAMALTAARIEAALSGDAPSGPAPRAPDTIADAQAAVTDRADVPDLTDAANATGVALPASGVISLPDPFERDVTPWLLRRLALAETLATAIGDDARLVQALSVKA